MTLLINQSIFIHIVCLWTQWVFSHVFTMSLTDEIGQKKHSNCPGFPGTVPGFGMLSWYPGLNRFVPVFRFLTKIFFHILIIFHQQCKKLHKLVFFHYLTPSFIAVHTLNAIKNITRTVLSSTKMLFWKHSTWTFGCYFKRHIFDSIL